MAKIASRKVSYYGIEFDSRTEGEFYLMLRADKNVKNIVCQPQYTLIEAFAVDCSKCKGEGKVESLKTGKLIQCRSCKGTGESKRRGMVYTADFLVTYQDGRQEVIDVKGYANERFPVVKKIFEWMTGQELVVWKKTRAGWKRS